MLILFKIDGVSKPAIQFLHKHTFVRFMLGTLYEMGEDDAALVFAKDMSTGRGKNANLLQACHFSLKPFQLFTHV